MTIAINSIKREAERNEPSVGALILARAVDDDSLSRLILETAAKR